MKELRIGLIVLGLNFLVVCVQAAPNLIANGDFEAGNTGFTSQYAFQSDLTSDIEGGGAGGYNIVANPQVSHPAWVSFYDHTLGTANGHMLVANGSLTGTKVVWAETICVKPCKKYRFSYWLRDCYATSPATIQCFINGVSMGVASAPHGTASWGQISYDVNPTYRCPSAGTGTCCTCPSSRKLVIQLVDTNKESNGNDFALDDITLEAVLQPPVAYIGCPPTGWACLSIFVGAFGSYDPDGCIVKYEWDWGDGSPVETTTWPFAFHIWTTTGSHTVKLTVTDNDGLTSTATASITINKLLWSGCP